jgi:hypothetical protein
MKLIQLFIPLYDPLGKKFPENYYKNIKKQLTEKFGGLTIYMRSPAIGLWKEDKQHVVKDDIIVFEVMTTEVDANYWKIYKNNLAKKFCQEELLIRSSDTQLI